MLVEATWARGRLLREYTVLLDPPALLPEPPAAAAAARPAQTRTRGNAARRRRRSSVRAPAPAPRDTGSCAGRATSALRRRTAGGAAPATAVPMAPCSVARRFGGSQPACVPAASAMNQMMVADLSGQSRRLRRQHEHAASRRDSAHTARRRDAVADRGGGQQPRRSVRSTLGRGARRSEHVRDSCRPAMHPRRANARSGATAGAAAGAARRRPRPSSSHSK